MTQHFARLAKDVLSIMYSTKTKPYYYGRQNDKVKIISENHDGMCVVENKDGQRYPIRKVNLKLIENEKQEANS